MKLYRSTQRKYTQRAQRRKERKIVVHPLKRNEDFEYFNFEIRNNIKFLISNSDIIYYFDPPEADGMTKK